MADLVTHQLFPCRRRTDEEKQIVRTMTIGLGGCKSKYPPGGVAMRRHRKCHERCRGCKTTFPFASDSEGTEGAEQEEIAIQSGN